MKLFSPLLVVFVAAVASLLFSGGGVTALRFAIIGDWGMGGKSTPWMPEMRSAQAVNEACSEFLCNFTLSCGDNIYTANVNLGLKESFQNLYASDVTGPFYLVSGNHDNIGPQIAYSKTNKRWKWPSRHYDFVVPIGDDGGASGHTAHFFGLDCMDGSLNGGAQYKWLEDKLDKSTSRWKILFAHYPMSGAGRHRREGSVTRLATLMDKYNAQVFFSGHDHILDVSAMQGRALPVSGAMARGGMMIRGIAGKWHKFTLTQPGEWNKYATDWPGHGFFTAEMSPNVLTIHAWDHYGGIMYSFAVTHDWIQKVKTMPESMYNKFPPPDEVRKSLEEEKTLPKGPGGGVLLFPDGREVPVGSNSGVTEKPIEKETRPSKMKEVVVTTPGPQLTAAKPKSGSAGDRHSTGDSHANPRTLPPSSSAGRRADEFLKYVTYTVSSECLNCDAGKVYATEPFSVYILGVALQQSARMFLTTSTAGCAMAADFPQYAQGSGLQQPIRNMHVFTVDVSSVCYVCLSIDGKNFYKLTRENVVESGDKHFEVEPGRAAEKKSEDYARKHQNDAPTPAPLAIGTAAPSGSVTASPSSPSSSSSSSSSAGTLLVVAGMSLLIGAGVTLVTRGKEETSRMTTTTASSPAAAASSPSASPTEMTTE